MGYETMQQQMMWHLEQGDCTTVLPNFRTFGFQADAVVTDPPYHLTTGKAGGSGAASLNLNSPQGRSRIGTGFMGKAWDGGDIAFQPDTWRHVLAALKPGGRMLCFGGTRTFHRIACAIEDAGFVFEDTIMWTYGQGMPKAKTRLKPAWEPILVMRKPGDNPALNIDACRVPVDDTTYAQTCSGDRGHGDNRGRQMDFNQTAGHASKIGRWPANLVHDNSDEVVTVFPDAPGQQRDLIGHSKARPTKTAFGNMAPALDHFARNDSGSAARFFYCTKATKAERCGSRHPTVKPIALLRWLIRLITPPDGLVLDPFAGTGTTGEAALAEGFDCMMIEQDPTYCADIRRRMETRT